MLPFGKIKDVPGTQSQVLSRLMEGLEEAGCVVSREGSNRLSVLIPGWERGFLPEVLFLPQLQQFFWDRMIVQVDERGAARYRMVYWSSTQLWFHGIVTAIFAMDVWFGSALSLSPMQFFLNFGCVQIIPAMLLLMSFELSRKAVLRRALA